MYIVSPLREILEGKVKAYKESLQLTKSMINLNFNDIIV